MILRWIEKKKKKSQMRAMRGVRGEGGGVCGLDFNR